jgi:D-alanyl-D-alanine carboxypeptidase
MREPAALTACRARTQNVALLAIVLLVAAVGATRPVRAQEVPELQINSTNYVLVDAETGEILAQRGAHERRAMASITKMFTAIETIESGRPDVLITTSDADMVSEFASQVGFAPGETFTVEELLYGMMLPSGNDAARALARGLGAQPGDNDVQAMQRFLDRLNLRIRNMGLTDTYLVNPDGWGVPGHYSTAYDLAAFMMYALHYPRFVQAFSSLTYETADGAYEFRNNNRMLRTYPGIIGGKTGYDDDAGWCLINVAERDGNRMIAVTLNGVAPDDWYDDNRVLLEYGFKEKARRQAAGVGLIGELVSYRDPDAAIILAMGTAGGLIGQPIVTAQPAPRTAAEMRRAETSPTSISTPSAIAASGAGLLAAATVAAALILLHATATWRLRSRPEIAGPRSSQSAPPAKNATLPEATATGSD